MLDEMPLNATGKVDRVALKKRAADQVAAEHPDWKSAGPRRLMTDPIDIARRCYQAYADSDRSAIEPLIADEFHFTSPLDNRIDGAAYFERCWPNNERIVSFDFIRLVADKDEVLVTYEGRNTDGKCFRNSEVLTIREGKIVEAEVYFGCSVPHEAAEGGFIRTD